MLLCNLQGVLIRDGAAGTGWIQVLLKSGLGGFRNLHVDLDGNAQVMLPHIGAMRSLTGHKSFLFPVQSDQNQYCKSKHKT